MSTARPIPSAFDLTGAVAVVTGAGSATGIGYAVARFLGQCGAAVVVTATTDRIGQRAAELAAEGVAASAVVADLTEESGAAGVVGAALERFGRLDIVVNNAGMVAVSDGDYLEGDLTSTDPARWRATIERNLTTAYLMTRAALPHLRASGRARDGRGHGDAGRGGLRGREGGDGRPDPGGRGGRGAARDDLQRRGAGVDRDGLADAG